jgi:hypothetical protein
VNGVQSEYPGCRLQFNVEGRRVRRYRRTVETAFRQAERSGEFALSEALRDIIAQEQDQKNGIDVLTNTERMKIAIQLAKHLFNSFLDCTQPIVIVYAVRSNSALCNNFVCRT